MARKRSNRDWLFRSLLLSGAAVVLLGGGIAAASIPSSSSGVFTACMVKKTGAVRLIDTTITTTSIRSHCTSTEATVTWNQRGLAGPSGPSGHSGPSGPSGPPGPPLGPNIRNYVLQSPADAPGYCMAIATTPSTKGYVITQVLVDTDIEIRIAVGGCDSGHIVTPGVSKSGLTLNPGFSVPPGSTINVVQNSGFNGSVFINGYEFTPSP